MQFSLFLMIQVHLSTSILGNSENKDPYCGFGTFLNNYAVFTKLTFFVCHISEEYSYLSFIFLMQNSSRTDLSL